jgi:hypothetical protein
VAKENTKAVEDRAVIHHIDRGKLPVSHHIDTRSLPVSHHIDMKMLPVSHHIEMDTLGDPADGSSTSVSTAADVDA